MEVDFVDFVCVVIVGDVVVFFICFSIGVVICMFGGEVVIDIFEVVSVIVIDVIFVVVMDFVFGFSGLVLMVFMVYKESVVVVFFGVVLFVMNIVCFV